MDAKTQLIGIVGQQYSGKSETAKHLSKYLVERQGFNDTGVNDPSTDLDYYVRQVRYNRYYNDHSNYEEIPNHLILIIPFAYDLKREISQTLGRTPAERDKIWMELHDPELKKFWRPVLRFWGTEIRRKLFGWDFWVDKLQARVELYGNCTVIVDDVRFLNEAAFIKQHGGKLFRMLPDPKLIPEQTNHQSETEPDEIPGCIDIPWEYVGGRVARITAELRDLDRYFGPPKR